MPRTLTAKLLCIADESSFKAFKTTRKTCKSEAETLTGGIQRSTSNSPGAKERKKTKERPDTLQG